MSETRFLAASEGKRHWTHEQRGERVFLMSDDLIARALLDWSEPVQLKIEKRDDGTYDLIARTFASPASVVVNEGDATNE